MVYAVLINSAATLGALALFSSGEVALGLAVHLIPVPYNILALVAVWRSAARYDGNPNWATAARATTVIVLPLAIVL